MQFQDDAQSYNFAFGIDESSPYNDSDFEMALVDALKLQVPGAFEILLRRYERQLLSVALRITKNVEDSEDAVQTTFLQVHKNVHRFRGESKFTTWLTSITINQSLMVLRRRKKCIVSIDSSLGDDEHTHFCEIRGSESSPEELYISQDLQMRALGVMSKLGKSAKGVAELYFLEEYLPREIGEILGISLSAVKSRLSRARQELRKRAAKRQWTTNGASIDPLYYAVTSPTQAILAAKRAKPALLVGDVLMPKSVGRTRN